MNYPIGMYSTEVTFRACGGQTNLVNKKLSYLFRVFIVHIVSGRSPALLKDRRLLFMTSRKLERQKWNLQIIKHVEY